MNTSLSDVDAVTAFSALEDSLPEIKPAKKGKKKPEDKRREKKKKVARLKPVLPPSHLTGYYHTPGKWGKHPIPIDDGTTTSVRFETDTGAFLYLRVRWDTERQEAVYSVSNQGTDPQRWAKNPVAAGVIGKEPVYNYNKPAKTRIKELTKALYNIIAVTDGMTSDGYYPDGKPKNSWTPEKAPQNISQYVKSWEKNGVIVKGIPVHCHCGNHKTKDGLFTCKDLHDRLMEAKLLISL